MKNIFHRDYLLIGIYSMIIIFFNLFFHETWRDELHVWIIAQNSNSLLEFINLRSTEAHPIVWDIIQYSVSIFTSNFIYIKLLNILFSFITAYYIVKYLPFHFYQKALLLCSYYFLYEYSIINRSYALSIMLIFICLDLIQNKKYKWFIIVTILAANTNILSAIIITSISIYYWKINTISTKQIAFITSGVLFSITHIFYQLFYNWDFQDAGYMSSINIDKNLILYKFALIYKGLIPIPIFQHEFWNTNFISFLWFEGNLIASVLSLILLTCIIYIFKSNKKLLFAYIIGNLLLITLFTFFWGGSQRHWGFFFILFLVFYTIFVQLKLGTKTTNLFFTLLLILQLPGSIYAYYMDYNFTFSNSERVAKYIEQNVDSSKVILTGIPDYTLSSIIYKTSGIDKFYNIQSDKIEAFTNWNRPENISKEVFNKRIIKIHKLNPSKKIIVILSFNSIDINNFGNIGFTFNHLKTFDSAILSDENYKIYVLNFD